MDDYNFELEIVGRHTNTILYFELAKEADKEYFEKVDELSKNSKKVTIDGKQYTLPPNELKELYRYCHTGYIFLKSFPEQKDKMEKNKSLGEALYLAILEFSNELEKMRIRSVVFSSICLEAFIYDYASKYFGDKFIKENFDNLKALSKWIVIPKFILNKQFSKEEQPYENLTKLYKERDKLIHHKSKPLSSPDNIIEEIREKIREGNLNNPANILKPFETVILVLSNLKEMEEEFLNPPTPPKGVDYSHIMKNMYKPKLLQWELKKI